jgi:hypothetical protein
MGWCSGTVVFDAVCGALLSEDKPDKKYAIKALIEALTDNDWDCEPDSEYWDHPLVKECFCETADYYKQIYADHEREE